MAGLLTTAADRPADWVNAGQALQPILLTASMCGAAVALHSQPLELPWLRGGALELFTESVRLYDPLLPCVAGPAPRGRDTTSGAPPLDELRLHQARSGTGTGPSTTPQQAATCGSRCGPCPPARPSST